MRQSRTCETCQWWDLIGACHAGPPSVDEGKVAWPFTHANDWCGAHQVRADLVGGDVRTPRSQETAS